MVNAPGNWYWHCPTVVHTHQQPENRALTSLTLILSRTNRWPVQRGFPNSSYVLYGKGVGDGYGPFMKMTEIAFDFFWMVGKGVVEILKLNKNTFWGWENEKIWGSTVDCQSWGFFIKLISAIVIFFRNRVKCREHKFGVSPSKITPSKRGGYEIPGCSQGNDLQRQMDHRFSSAQDISGHGTREAKVTESF